MKRLQYLLPFPFLFLFISSFINSDSDQVSYPEGFRTWRHVKTTLVRNPKFEHVKGFDHIYANEKAIIGYNTGEFPDGSVIVFDVIEAIENNPDIIEGNRKFIDVMEKDSKKFAATGGWGFEEFNGDTQERVLTESTSKGCFNCHSTKKTDGYVFSKLRK